MSCRSENVTECSEKGDKRQHLMDHFDAGTPNALVEELRKARAGTRQQKKNKWTW